MIKDFIFSAIVISVVAYIELGITLLCLFYKGRKEDGRETDDTVI